MKRLLLLLIFFPVILFGQTRRKAIADSVKAAATNLQNLSELVTNNPGTKVANIHVSDSGDYVTIVVRLHIIEASFINALPPLPVVNIETEKPVSARLSAFNVPPLPPPIEEPEKIAALSPVAVLKLNTGDIAAVKPDTITAPPIPDAGMMETLPLPAITIFRIEVIVAKADTITAPPIPDATMTEALPLPVVTLFRIEVIIARADTAIAPPMPEFRVDIIDDIPLLAAVKLAKTILPAHKLDTMAIPSFEETRMPVGGMHLSEEGYSLLEKLEGFSPDLYSLKDGGFTIGFGFFVPYGETSMWEKGLTWEQAELIIRQKVPAYEDQVKRYINIPLTQNEFDALTMLAYNLGGFSKATSIVNDVNEQADFDKVQSDWKRFVHSKAPNVSKGLMNRRRDELEVRNVSDYKPERKIQILKRK
jgi:lysozyme